MVISKEVILTIQLSGESLKMFQKTLENVLAANHTANQGIGFIGTKEVKLIEEILKSISDE